MIKVYGAEWCGDTKQTLGYLDNQNINYEYIDVEKDETASEWVKSKNGGKERKPTVQIGARVLSVPTQEELTAALESESLIK